MNWQLVWPAWWKLWPYYNTTKEWYYGDGTSGDWYYFQRTFCFGPLQLRWKA